MIVGKKISRGVVRYFQGGGRKVSRGVVRYFQGDDNILEDSFLKKFLTNYINYFKLKKVLNCIDISTPRRVDLFCLKIVMIIVFTVLYLTRLKNICII